MSKIIHFLGMTFGFSQRESNAFVVLSFILFIALGLTIGFHYFYEPPRITKENNHAYLDSLISTLEDHQKFTPSTKKPFRFDPNSATFDDWQNLGINNKISQRIINYISKGGFFNSKEDLKKIYGFKDNDYVRLEPYIVIKERQAFSNSNKVFEKEKGVSKFPFKIDKFNLNDADTIQLSKIRGIGTKLSQRIINFREKLGGFINQNQLYEVYNLDSLVVTLLIKNSFIEKDFIPKKININTADKNTLASHPYINYKLADRIISYRIQHGEFSKVEDLYSIKEIDIEALKKVFPYLK